MAPSTIPKAFELVGQFHQDLAAEGNIRAKVAVIQRYASKLQLRGEELSADADAIQNVAAIYVDKGAILEILGCIPKNLPGSTTEKRQERAIKLLVACWSWQRVQHYQWESLPHKTLEVFAQAARKYPAWEHFVTLANHQLLNRHERSVKDQKVLRIGDHSPSASIKNPLSPLERGDLTAVIHTCAPARDVEMRARKWLIPCFCMSKMFAGNEKRMALFVVQFDDYGMLVPAQSPLPKKLRTCSDCEPQRKQTSGLRLQTHPLSGSTSRIVNMIQRDDSFSDELRSPSESQSTASLDGDSQREKSLAHESVPSDHDSPPVSIDSTDGQTSADKSIEGQTDQSSVHSSRVLCKAQPGADIECIPVTTRASPTTMPKHKAHAKTNPHFSILAPPDQDTSACRIEHLINRKYNDVLLSYHARVQAEAVKGPLYRLRSEWFAADTEHAKIWCPPECGLGVGSAPSEEDADVWHYTMDVFLDHARQQKSFIRPVLIKQDATRSDLEFHCIDDLLELLQDAHRHKTLDVNSLEDATAEAMPFARFKSAFHDGTGLNALNLRNFTASHRPFFTMLPRFRLLRTLVESVEIDSRKKTVSSPSDISSCSAGFNILATANAFSGAHQDCLGHTWVRNLDGLKFWMTVHPTEMQSSWGEFYKHGSHWSPRGKARLTIIEKGDVFVMMPDEFGRATVHSVHSPVASLMEGAMFFDKTRILHTLNCIFEIGRHQNSTNEAIAHQLPRIMKELGCLVRSGWDSAADRDFQTDCADALQKLESLGCRCSKLADQQVCACKREGRRCTAWCSGHPDLPTLECMEEGAASNSQKKGCCTGRSTTRKRKHV